jgi:pyruvate/2-oxoglutarate dehydrogenase complex dihydrolipoamide dehydrogenase (E3) component
VDSYENLVIGSGVAGKCIAWALGKAGQRTALVERRWLGGACPNVACLPSKNLIYSAKVASLARRGAEFGVDTGTVTIDMAAVQRRKRQMVDGLQRLHEELTAGSGAELVRGDARFIGPKTVEVGLNDGGTRRITAERIFVAVGTHAAMPDVPGLAAAQPMTNVEALDLDHLPAHLIVIGGGYVGLELSQAMRRFGARVTVIEPGPQVAGHEDPDVAAALLDLFRDEQIDVLLDTRLVRVEGRSGQRLRVHVRDGRGERILDGTDLLVATGRVPNTAGLGLDVAGVDVDEHGSIRVDERLRTSAPRIWAMGECAGSPHFTHVGFDDFRVVHEQLTGGSRTTLERLIPFCMFTDPELARVGRNEREAKRDGVHYRVATMPMGEVLRTRTVSEPRGLMKILVSAHDDDIVGFTAFGFEASELMAVVQTAMAAGMSYTGLRDVIFTHPTMSEGFFDLLIKVPPR